MSHDLSPKTLDRNNSYYTYTEMSYYGSVILSKSLGFLKPVSSIDINFLPSIFTHFDELAEPASARSCMFSITLPRSICRTVCLTAVNDFVLLIFINDMQSIAISPIMAI